MEHERSRLTIWSFLKGLFKIVVGLSLFAQAIMFLVLMTFIITIASGISVGFSGGRGGNSPDIQVPEGGALVLNPDGVLVEVAPPVDPVEEFLNGAMGQENPLQISVHDLVLSLIHI